MFKEFLDEKMWRERYGKTKQEENEKSDPLCSTFDQNSKNEDVVLLANTGLFETILQNNEMIITNISLHREITRISRNHKKHRVYVVSENNKYHINLFRRNVACDFKYDEADVTFDKSFTFLKETVKFDEQLFCDMTRVKRKKGRLLKPGVSCTVKSYRCIVD
ncbi:hypothetical protein RF11_00669 [Thelohanellus kitauei]|uniref:Uncharacterized protein n=1 Tax=Thelohanellus kitauei TaxID=669202 RepID=A0A0C2JR96_THEKT|nr:hypothetical protein RF11_00669 [Thelohanellus kitauei]